MIANFFWSGSNFQYLDRLTILSHLSVGHEVIIWLRGNPPKNIYWPSNIPGIEIKNADEIVSCDKFYNSLPGTDSRNRKLRITSAYWKFHFMYQRGGLYCDTDAIALKPFPSDEWINVISGEENEKVYYIGVLKAPPKHPVFKYCIENIRHRWGNPRVYTAAVEKYNIPPSHDFRLFYPFSASEHNKHLKTFGTTILFSRGEIPDAFSIHGYGNKISSLNISEETISNYPDSILYKINEDLKSKPIKAYIPDRPKLAVLMLSWLRLDSLLVTLKQIPQSCSLPLHLILRVQGAERLTLEDRKAITSAAADFYSTDIYFTRDNVGTAAARLDLTHRGAKQSYPYMMFTDDDITFPDGGIEEQIQVLDNYPEIGSISLRPGGIRRVQKVIDTSNGVNLIPFNEAKETLCEVFLVGSASLMFRTELYTDHLIAPDPAYYIGTWDWDFIMQIREAGYKVCMLTNKTIKNRRGGCPEYKSKRDNTIYAKGNHRLFIEKWGFNPLTSKDWNTDFTKPVSKDDPLVRAKILTSLNNEECISYQLNPKPERSENHWKTRIIRGQERLKIKQSMGASKCPETNSFAIS